MADPAGFASVSQDPKALRDVASVSVDTGTVSGRRWLSVNALAEIACPYIDVYDGVEESGQAMWATVHPVGRGEGIKIYTGSVNRSTSLVFKFRWESGDAASDIQRAVLAPAKFLQALGRNFVDAAGKVYPPPPVLLTVPGLSMRAIVESCSIRWMSPWWTDEAGSILPTGADVTVAFSEVQVGSYAGDGASV